MIMIIIITEQSALLVCSASTTSIRSTGKEFQSLIVFDLFVAELSTR